MRLLFVTILLWGLCTAPLRGAEFSPNFELELKIAAADQFVSGIVILESPIDVQGLDLTLHAKGAAKRERYEMVYRALQYNASQTQPKFEAELRSLKERGSVDGYTAYWIDNMFVVNAKPQFFYSLMERGDIRAVSENFTVELIEPLRGDVSIEAPNEERRPARDPLDEELTTPGQDAIGATRVNREMGITGQGVLVANLDTGVDGTHPALASRWRGLTAGNSAAWLDVLNSSPTNFPTDNNSHGTHVMGTICGREIDANGDTITVGSAPDAEWIACNAIDQGTGESLNNDILTAFQWFANPDGDMSTTNDVPDVLQNSWGVNRNFVTYTQCFDLWNTAIANLEALGCVVTFSAGNEGPSSSTMRSPAIHELSEVQFFSVGAASVADTSTPPYPIAIFSSRGPSPCGGTFIKPEIAAPGVNIYSSIPGGLYSGSFSGTSMAGPHVAGILALMRQACPNCDPITLKEALLETAVDAGYGAVGNDNTFGYGFLNGYAAVQSVFNLGVVRGIVSCGGQAVEGATVKLIEVGKSEVTDTLGGYLIGASAATYTIQVTKFGYDPMTVPGVEILSGDTIEINIELFLSPLAVVSGKVYDENGEGYPGSAVEALNVPVDPTSSDVDGTYSLSLPTGLTYTLRAYSACGADEATFFLSADTTIDLYMPRALYCYDFETDDQGWTVGAPDDGATIGMWGRMDPQYTSNSGHDCQPEDDHTAAGVNCFVTNGVAGSTAGQYDVDAGKTTLLSPIWNLSGQSGVVLEVYSWYSNDNGQAPGEDFFILDVSNDGGTTWINLVREQIDWEYWKRSIFLLDNYLPITNQMRVRFLAQDFGIGSLVEAAVDDICVLAAGALPPDELSIVALEEGMQLTWKPVHGATSYTVWRGPAYPATTSNTAQVATITDTFYVDVSATDTLGYYIVTSNR